MKATTGDLFRAVWVLADPANASMTDREVFDRGFPGDEGASARSFAFEGDSTAWLGSDHGPRDGSPAGGRFSRPKLVSEEASQEMIGMMARQFYTSRLPQRVRWQGVNVAHKTGDWPPIAGNDVGILFYDGGPTIVSVFTNPEHGRLLRARSHPRSPRRGHRPGVALDGAYIRSSAILTASYTFTTPPVTERRPKGMRAPSPGRATTSVSYFTDDSRMIRRTSDASRSGK